MIEAVGLEGCGSTYLGAEYVKLLGVCHYGLLDLKGTLINP